MTQALTIAGVWFTVLANVVTVLRTVMGTLLAGIGVRIAISR
ncbi:MAG: hypothetical protein WBA97_14165 [Actinophytocola sp.]